jgi:hypothetical protein
MPGDSITRSVGDWRQARRPRVGVAVIVFAFLVGVSAADAWRLDDSSKAARPSARALKFVTACEVFTLAEAETLIGANATENPGDSHTVDLGGQRNTQCAYSSGENALAGAFSLQDNTSTFVGTNGQNDWVQFVYDTSNGGTSGNACIWQIDLLTPDHNGYNATGCVNINTGSVLCCVEGLELPGLLVMAVSDLGGSAVAAVQPDLYGLEDGDNWNLAAGSILGLSFSQAVFAPGSEEQIALNASSCESFGGFITFPLPCGAQGLTGAGPPLKPDAFSTWPLFGGTAETNNLEPVTGSPAKHLPKLSWSHGGHVATVIVTETRSGHCVHGSPPLCR